MTDKVIALVEALRTACSDYDDCDDCPSYKWCHDKSCPTLCEAAADLIESLAVELEQVKQECDGLSIMLTAAQSAAETYKRERDAAIRRMLEADKNNPFACSFCKHDKVCDGRLPVCGDCGMDDCPCNTCLNHSNWEWCGAKEET